MSFRRTEDRALRRVQAERIVTRIQNRYPTGYTGQAWVWRLRGAKIVKKYFSAER